MALLDAQTGEPITTEGMRYGLRAVVLGIPCDPQWRTVAGLERYFGYPVDFAPVKQRFWGGVNVVPDRSAREHRPTRMNRYAPWTVFSVSVQSAAASP